MTVLGTSCGVPTAERGLPSVAVRREGEVLLFDCGEGTQRQMMRFGISFMKVSRIFVTHFHGDHYLGLFGLIQSMSFFGREDPLEVYGPAGTSEISRLLGAIGHFRSGFEVRGHDLEDSEVQGMGYTVVSRWVDHVVPTLGYALIEDARPGRFDPDKALSLGVPEGRLFKEIQQGRSVVVDGREIAPGDILGPPRPGRKIVYFGDVIGTDPAVALARDADLLICEATFCDDLSERAEETGHLTVRQACGIAKRAGVKRLLLTHFSPRYDLEDIQREVEFPNAILGRDGATLEVRNP